MYFAIGFFIVCLFLVIIIFSFPQFSPIPYYPSNAKDMPLILNALNIKNGQTIIDLGAGDGIVIFEASKQAFIKKYNTQFYAVEINPILLSILHVRRLFHANRKNIHILNKDMFSIAYSSLLTVQNPHLTFYIYISPWFIEKTVANITKQLHKFEVVSYFYQVKFLPRLRETLKTGVHKVFSYKI